MIRPYQLDLKNRVFQAWQAGYKFPLVVLPTGAGKTFTFTEVVKCFGQPTCAIAHRQEIVGQISLSFARAGIRHQIIGPRNVIRLVNRLHMEELGRSYYSSNAPVAVAGVDTLIARAGSLEQWARSVNLWVLDEAHHMLAGGSVNKWGKAAAMFPNARGLGVTATPVRADGKGLGAHADGLFECILEGPDMRWLINEGFLTDYRIFAPPSDLDLSTVRIGSDGDYSRPTLKTAVQQSTVTGDVVSHYLRIAPGKLGITFAVDVETATGIATQFNASGVPSAVVHAKTKDADRVGLIRKFKNRELLQLVNVDLFGEGFDLPAVEVVSFARPTQSYGLYSQQFGRALRPLPGKSHAIIIDHVGNVVRHGLPDAPRQWTLDRRPRGVKKASDPDVMPVRVCPGCTGVFERVYRACPYCGFVPAPAARSGPEYVDGDLTELDPAALAALRAGAVDVDKSRADYLYESGADRLPMVAAAGAANRFAEKQEAQKGLRESIAYWAGYQRMNGRPDSESYRRFYHRFGMDVLSAQALGRKDAEALKKLIDTDINTFGA